MKNLSIKLRGFIGIKKGLGLDEIDLDLSSLDGLTAIAGPNGRGKTSLIDNLHPFRVLASRSGALQHHCTLRDSVKEYCFNMGGSDYKTILKIDNHSGRQEAFIYKNGKAESETNGKVKEYDKYIEDLFGSSNLFFNSVFCAQNSKKISQLTPAALTALFIEFLGHEKYKLYTDTSNKAATIIAGKKFDLGAEKNRIADKLLELADIDKEIERLAESKAAHEREIPGVKEDIQATNDALQASQAAVIENDKIKIKLDALKRERDKISSENTNDQIEVDGKLAALRKKAEALCKQIEAIDQVLSQKEEIAAAADKIKAIEALIIETTQELSQVNIDIEELDLEIQRLRKEQAGSKENFDEKIEAVKKLVQDTEIKNVELKACQEKTKALETRDPACQSQTCSFIVSALQAEKDLPALKTAAAGLEGLKKELEDLELEAKAVSDVYERKISEINIEASKSVKARCEASIAELNRQKENLSLLAAKQGELDVAQANRDALNEQKGDIIDQGVKMSQELTERVREKTAALEAINKKMIDLKRKIDTPAADSLATWEKKIEDLEKNLRFKESQISKVENIIKDRENDLAKKLELKAELKALDDRSKMLQREASQWIYIKNACSKDGLQALEIESVAPGIAANANDLLMTAFGPGSSVDFRTLNEDGRETMEIRVIDEDGHDVLLGDRSGGQQVWALKALRLAMTMISKEKSGRDFKTFFADEEDGALSVDNAERFVNLYRALMDQGGFEDCFYISHKKECLAMADNSINFLTNENAISIR